MVTIRYKIVISSVFSDSAAERAGLLPGDVIQLYDNVDVFSGDELRYATAAGTLGELVTMTIRRNGLNMDIFVERGPLGIHIAAAGSNPQNRSLALDVYLRHAL